VKNNAVKCTSMWRKLAQGEVFGASIGQSVRIRRQAGNMLRAETYCENNRRDLQIVLYQSLHIAYLTCPE